MAGELCPGGGEVDEGALAGVALLAVQEHVGPPHHHPPTAGLNIEEIPEKANNRFRRHEISGHQSGAGGVTPFPFTTIIIAS
jgi:hypothetical protein